MRYILFALVMVSALPIAAGAAAEKVSLRDAINLALATDHRLKASGYERTAVGEEVSVSRSRYLPRVFLEESAVATNSPTELFMFRLNEGRFAFGGDLNHPKAGGDFRTALSLEQPLFDFSIGRGLAVAEADDRAHGHALTREREEVAYRVLEIYLLVQQAKGRLFSAEQAVGDAREHLRLAGVRSQSGVGLKADELRARTFLAEREIEQIRAKNDLRMAQLKLASAIGERAGAATDIKEDATLGDVGQSSDELVRQALENRPDLQQAVASVERAEAGVSLARASYLPKVYGSASYQMNDRDVPFGRDNDSWTVGALLRWDLFDSARGHEAGRARAMRDAASEQLEQRRSEIALEVEEKYLRRDVALKQLEVTRHASADAEEAVRLVTKRFENSLATMVETLDAQTALNMSRTRKVDAEIAAIRASADLWHAAGIFLKEVNK